jgi:hypothetical protein
VRRLVTFTIAWLFAAVAATTAAWKGVALVTDEVTGDRPPALAASEVQERLDEGSPASSSVPSTTAPATGPTTTTTAPGPTQPAPVTRTFRLEGGTVTISFSPTRVAATAVTPNPGFGVNKNEPEDGGWRVELESESHRSRLDAWWDGAPQFRPREDPR